MAQIDGAGRYSRPPNRSNKSSHIQTRTRSGRGEEVTSATASSVDDDATIKYIKRVLCAQSTAASTTDNLSLEELLPPLTSSNEIDVQLYAIIAVILNQFVQKWYNRITPDQQFVAEIVQIIAHCTRGLEQRLREVDLEEILFDELAALLIAHVDSVRLARAQCRRVNSTQSIYHSMHPHNALSPLPIDAETMSEQQDNEIAWSQLLVSRILPLILPPEDLLNPCLHILVSEIFSEMVLHNAICKASEPWLLWEGVTRILGLLRPGQASRRAEHDGGMDDGGALSSSVSPPGDHGASKAERGYLSVILNVFWSTLQLIWTVGLLLRFTITSLARASSIPARSKLRAAAQSRPSDNQSTNLADTLISEGANEDVQDPLLAHPRSLLSFRIWSLVSRLTSFDQRMPWTSGFVSLLQWTLLHGPGRVGGPNSALDRLIASQLRLRASLLPPLLRSVRLALFPNNALAASRVPPSEAAIAAIKRACAAAVVTAVPELARPIVFATRDETVMAHDVQLSLDDFGDTHVNKHFLVGAIELLVVRLFPELAEAPVDE